MSWCTHKKERIFSTLQWIWNSFRSWSLWFPSLPYNSCDARIFFYEDSSNFWFWRIPNANHSPTFFYFLLCRSRYDCIFVIWKILRCVSSKPFLVHLTFHESFAIDNSHFVKVNKEWSFSIAPLFETWEKTWAWLFSSLKQEKVLNQWCQNRKKTGFSQIYGIS